MVIMKTVLALFLALAFAANAHAILRPRFPHRTHPPMGDHRSAQFLSDDSNRTARSATVAALTASLKAGESRVEGIRVAKESRDRNGATAQVLTGP
jgi:hypothetical protein